MSFDDPLNLCMSERKALDFIILRQFAECAQTLNAKGPEAQLAWLAGRGVESEDAIYVTELIALVDPGLDCLGAIFAKEFLGKIPLGSDLRPGPGATPPML